MSKPQANVELFTCDQLIDLLDQAQESGVPWRVEYDTDEGEEIRVSMGVRNFQVTRAAEAFGFEVIAPAQITALVRRGSEAYIEKREPHIVSAVKAWMQEEGAPANADGSLAVEYFGETPDN